ncbi:unnamed protein product, partial [Brachionus calyciflorus]
MEIKRKQRPYDNTPTNVLIAYANNENSFIQLIKNGLRLNGRIYPCEPLIFRVLQCSKCGHLGHKINECVKKINTCLRCAEDGHQAINKKHIGYSKSCKIIRNELEKCNKFYWKTLKNYEVEDKNMEKIFDKEKSQMVKKETEVNGKNDILLEMIEIIAEKVDLIEQELEKQQEEIENLNFVVIKHDEIIERQILEMEIRISGINLFLENNFMIIKNFLEEGNIMLKAPPNCPDINIIELVWTELKNYIRRKNCKTSEELVKNVYRFVETKLTAEKCSRYIIKHKKVLQRIIRRNGAWSHFAERPLPSAGVIPFVRGYICNLNFSCSQTPHDLYSNGELFSLISLTSDTLNFLNQPNVVSSTRTLAKVANRL